MKILSKEEFYNLPKGTLYSDFTNGYCEGLFIKGDSLLDGDNHYDFTMFSPLSSINPKSEHELIDKWPYVEGLDILIHLSAKDSLFEREGYFNPASKYAVFSSEEIKDFAKLISEAKSYENPDT
jgi:hypothetical protein